MKKRKITYAMLIMVFLFVNMSGLCSAQCLEECCLRGQSVTHGSDSSMLAHDCDQPLDGERHVSLCNDARSDDSGITSSYDIDFYNWVFQEQEIEFPIISANLVRKHSNTSDPPFEPLFILNLTILC